MVYASIKGSYEKANQIINLRPLYEKFSLAFSEYLKKFLGTP